MSAHSFELNAKKILRQIHPNLSLSHDGLEFLYHFFKRLHDVMNDAIPLLKKHNRSSIEKWIRCLLMDTELARYAIQDVTKGVETVFTGNLWNTDEALVKRYLSVTFEYLLAEVLELAGNATFDNQRKRIISYYIWVAISWDNELATVFRFLGFDEYRFPLDVLLHHRGRLNTYLYYHTHHGQIYKMTTEHLLQTFKKYLY